MTLRCQRACLDVYTLLPHDRLISCSVSPSLGARRTGRVSFLAVTMSRRISKRLQCRDENPRSL